MNRAEKTCGRLARLRGRMAEKGIDAYLVMSDDYHASEYVGGYFKCREWLSGFDGSAGTLVVTAAEAGLWTDGRYFIQAEQQLAGTGIMLRRMGEDGVPEVPEYLAEVLRQGGCLGYDGRTVNARYAEKIRDELKAVTGIRFEENADLISGLWEDRPAFPAHKIWLFDDTEEAEYAGRTRTEKLRNLRSDMKREKADRHLIASLDDIAWLYNFRGDDIAYTPVALAYTLVTEQEALLYIAPEVVGAEEAVILSRDGIRLRPYFQVYEDLKELPAGERLLLDAGSVNIALLSAVPDSVEIIKKQNPTTSAKAVKTDAEMENERRAHVYDGVAVTKLLYWLKRQRDTDDFKNGKLTELAVCKKLQKLREMQPGFLQQSFAPIVASGAHGAIVHYEPTEETDVPLSDNSFVLIDTGGHYVYGTTDITRTVALGRLSETQKKHYTAVLKGNLGLAAAYFKYGCTGQNLDVLARAPLWEAGLDFNHGTGHGVGYLLSVHEGPNAIRIKERDGAPRTALEEGMVTSDEPGVYLEGQYGIRLENLILCKKADKTDFGQFMEFETLTLVPFDRDAILPECMSAREIGLLNDYHARVREVISPYLKEEEREWLAEVTKPVQI